MSNRTQYTVTSPDGKRVYKLYGCAKNGILHYHSDTNHRIQHYNGFYGFEGMGAEEVIAFLEGYIKGREAK